jgi:glucokinase
MPSDWILGFDVGGTKTAVLAGTANGEVWKRRAERSPAADGFEAMWASMTAMADGLIAERGRPGAVSVSIGGPLDSENGIVYSPPNLPGWDAIPLKDLLADRFGVPAYVEHDAKAGALAEWLFGAGRGCRNVVFLTFGTGLGAGLILDGRLHRGSTGNAGEVGHWRMSGRGPLAYGKRGSWEALSSGTGLPRLARHLYPDHEWPEDLDAEMLVGRARAGDARASRVVRTSARWLGRGITYLVDLLDPEVVVLGSLAVRAGDLFLPVVRRVVDRECLERNRGCRVVASELGERIGDLAALCAALYQGRLHPAV